MKYEVYTDGAYSWKNNEGAFAFVILKDCHDIVMQRAYKIKDESNNRAELKAIIAAIHNLPKDANDVEVISDSQYALNTLSGRWGQGKNKDLFDVWRTVRNSHLGVHITWTWVKGHDGDYFNELCDKLCCDVLGYDPAEEYAKFKKKKQ